MLAASSAFGGWQETQNSSYILSPEVLLDAFFPEAIRQRIIHARHAAGADQPYAPEAARMLVAMAQAAGSWWAAAAPPQPKPISGR